MKKIKKWLLILCIAIVVVVTGALSYITLALPNIGDPEDIKITYTPERVERGKYLATHVTVCMDCHSGRDFSKLGGPIKPERLGAGGDKFDPAVGLPGTVYVPNITPYHLKDWTDGELFRAITSGVKKDGSAIFPIMPWSSYAKMDREDIYDIIAYIRSLEPKTGDYPERRLDFPLNILVHTMPQKAALGKRPSESDTLKYGAYLVASAACQDCHTQADKGAPIPGMEFAGGNEFGLPGGAKVRSSNITPDKQTGIGNWTKEQFVARFKMYADSTYKPADVKPGEFQTVMPWLMYGGMRTADLEAIYAYIKTIKPIKNKVLKFSPKSVTKA